MYNLKLSIPLKLIIRSEKDTVKENITKNKYLNLVAQL